MYNFVIEERKMKEENEIVSAASVPGRGQSLLSSLRKFIEGLDYDPQLYVHTSLKEIMDSVPQIEARLAVLEKREGNSPVPEITETEERE
jgi:hypothetical protein